MADESQMLASKAELSRIGFSPIPAHWSVVEIGELLSEERGISVGVMYPGEHDPSGIPLIRAGDLENNCINPKPDFRITSIKHHEYRRTELNGGEILITLVGAYFGQCAIVPKSLSGWNTARAVGVLRLRDPNDAKFVRQCFLSGPIQNLINAWANTTAQPTLNLKEIRQIPIPWPPDSERRAIADVGSKLDEKIELNRRMNATLEAMARALFQSWFVHFDPVRAKLDGREPIGLDPGTAALFPDSFHDSPLGLIPYGWEVKTIADVTFRVTKGDTPRSEAISACPKNDRLIPMLRVNAITEDGEVLLDKAEMIPESIHLGKSKRSILEENDILYTNAGTIGRVALVQKDFLPANTNQAMAIIRPDPARVPPAFLYMIMRQPEFQTVLHHDIVQAVQANLALGKISAAQAVFPPMETLTRLTAPLVILLNKVFENRTQSRTLATLRDTLLPKLLSGELSVTDAINSVAEEQA